MKTSFRFITLLIICMSLLLTISMPVSAASSLVISNPVVTFCTTIDSQVDFNATFSLDPGAQIFWDVDDPDGIHFGPLLSSLNVNPSPIIWGIYMDFSAQTFPYTWSFSYWVENAGVISNVNVFEVTCTGAGVGTVVSGTSTSDVTEKSRFVFSDGRINRYDTGTPVVLYAVDDALHIYDASDGSFLMQVSAEQIATVAECPSTNTTIASENGITLSRLHEHSDGTCPFQLNAPTGEGSKMYVIIFSDLSANSSYESFDFNG